MYKQTSFIVSILLMGSITAIVPPVAEAQISMSRKKSTTEVKRLLEEGRRLVNARDYNGALAIYQRAAALEPKNPTIFSGIGFLQAQSGNFRDALISYRRAIALNGNNSDYYYAVAYIHGNLGDMKASKEAYRKAIQLNRNNVNAYLGLMVTQSRLGNYDAAKWAYEQLLERDSKNARAHELMGSIFKKQGKRQEAILQLRKARDLYERQRKFDGANRVDGLLRTLGV
ncbi:MAG: tetratricopeptide repeat protein [Nostocaceae cyanobacterium]|nr:tetratricopeptide repeat protein [Nostocaceae cyanobacterium]